MSKEKKGFSMLTYHIRIFNPLKPKYSEWYGPSLTLEHTIQICWSERVN